MKKFNPHDILRGRNIGLWLVLNGLYGFYIGSVGGQISASDFQALGGLVAIFFTPFWALYGGMASVGPSSFGSIAFSVGAILVVLGYWLYKGAKA